MPRYHSPHRLALARDQRAYLSAEVTEMRLAGKCYREIAEALGISITQVYRLFDAKKQEFTARSNESIAHWTEKQVERYEAVIRLAAKAFEASKQDKIRVEKSRDADGKLVRKIVREPQSGNPAYLAQITAALARIDKLKGLEAPERSEVAAIVSAGPQLPQVRIIEDDDWYGNASRLLPDHSTSEADAASTGNPVECIEVQSCGVRPAMGQDGDGTASDDPGPRQLPWPVPGSD